MMKNDNTTPADPDARGQTPGREAFATAEEAWLWAMAAFVASCDGRPVPAGPCHPRDVFEIVNHLYCRRIIDTRHAYILRTWGERGMAPNPKSLRSSDSILELSDIAFERAQSRAWRDALDRLTPMLISEGIVAPPEMHA